MLSVQAIADINSETLTAKECRSLYDKFIVIEIRDNRHVGRCDQAPSRISAKKSRFFNNSRKLCKLVQKLCKLSLQE